MWYFWIIYLMIVFSAYAAPKRTIIIWMTARLLLNAQIALWYTPPIMSLEVGVDMTLLLIYYMRLSKSNIVNREPFILKDVIKWLVFSYTLSFVFSSVPREFFAVKEIAKYYVQNIGALFILQRCLNTKEDVRLYFKTAMVIAVMIAGLGILESVMNDNPVQDFIYKITPHNEYTAHRNYYKPPYLTKSGNLNHRYGMVRAYSFFGIHIAFGCACLYLLYLLYLNYLHRLIPSNRKHVLLVVLMLMGGVIVSNSKTGLLGLVFLIPAFLHRRMLFNKRFIIPLIFLIGIFACYPSYLKNYISLFDPEVAMEGRGSTVAVRMVQMEVAMSLFRMHPIIGNGIGSLNYLGKNTDLADGILGAESSLMQILPERGIVGLAVYFYMFYSLYKKCRGYIPKRELTFYLLSIIVMEIATGVLNMTVWCGVLIAVRRMFQLKGCEENSLDIPYHMPHRFKKRLFA